MDKVTRQCPQTTTFLKRKESRSGIKPRSFRLPARPNALPLGQTGSHLRYKTRPVFIYPLISTCPLHPPSMHCKTRPVTRPVKREIFPRENVPSLSWRHLFGTHCWPLSEMYQHGLSSNPTSKPSCLTKLSSRI